MSTDSPHWVRGLAPGQTAPSAGLVEQRRVRKLALNSLTTVTADPRAATMRPFERTHDIDGWLRVNNAAFVWHPDQADWQRADLERLLDLPWIRPDGLLVHDSGPGGAIDAFCFCRPAPPGDPDAGEIHIIAVHPDSHGHGLGRAVVLAGLRWIASAGFARAVLWTEADNHSALRLYHDLGFTDVCDDVEYG